MSRSPSCGGSTRRRDVQQATSPRGVLEFAAHLGTDEVEMLVITNTDGTLSVEETRFNVTIES